MFEHWVVRKDVVKYNLLVIFIHHCMNDLLLYFILPAALHVRCQEQLIVVTQLSRLVNFNQLYADNSNWMACIMLCNVSDGKYTGVEKLQQCG
jgi:hypothetical protein